MSRLKGTESQIADCRVHVVRKRNACSCRGSKVLVAANLHYSGALMPHYALQLLALLVALPRGDALLSIYESGSTDDTGALSRCLPPRFWPTKRRRDILTPQRLAVDPRTCSTRRLEAS